MERVLGVEGQGAGIGVGRCRTSGLVRFTALPSYSPRKNRTHLKHKDRQLFSSSVYLSVFLDSIQ